MGTWGLGSFENDDAGDWADALTRSKDASLIVETLRIVAEWGDEYLEAPECAQALAAAESVAAFNKVGSSDLPDKVKLWVVDHSDIDIRSYVPLALKAIKRIMTESELKELWDETDDANAWHEIVNSLESRLRQLS